MQIHPKGTVKPGLNIEWDYYMPVVISRLYFDHVKEYFVLNVLFVQVQQYLILNVLLLIAVLIRLHDSLVSCSIQLIITADIISSTLMREDNPFNTVNWPDGQSRKRKTSMIKRLLFQSCEVHICFSFIGLSYICACYCVCLGPE